MNPRGPWLRAGGVGKPHGLDGSFYVIDPKPQLLDPGRRVVLAGNEVEIAARKGSDRRPIVRLNEVSDRSGVEAIRGEQLLVAREDAPAPKRTNGGKRISKAAWSGQATGRWEW